MKSLLVSVFCIFCAQAGFAQAGGAKAASATPSKPALEALPQASLQFKAAGRGLAVSPKDLFLGYPFCSADGTIYLNARVPPDYVNQFLIGVSSKGELSRYSLIPAQGLVNTVVYSVDAKGSDVYALVSGEKIEELRKNGIDPQSVAAENASYFHFFILHFGHSLAIPDLIRLDLPFQPLKLATTGDGNFIVLGLDTVNQLPVVAVVDDTGELIRELDLNSEFGGRQAIVARAQKVFSKSNSHSEAPESAQFGLALDTAQLAHYRDSVLMLMPGMDAKVFTIQSDGDVASTPLRLPQGISAMSFAPSDGDDWFVRASDDTTHVNTLLLKVDPLNGEVKQMISTAPLPSFDITCVHNGTYVGIHWVGKKGDEKMFLMRAHP